MSDPEPGAFGAVDVGAVPLVATFEAADAGFAARSPCDLAAEGFSVFFDAIFLRCSAFAGITTLVMPRPVSRLSILASPCRWSAVTTCRARPARFLIRSTAGVSCGASGELPCATV